MSYFYIAQIVSVVTVITTAIGILQKEKYKTMLCFTIANISIMTTYFLLGRYLSIILVGMACLRTFVYYAFAVKNKQPNGYIMASFQVVCVITSILLWEDYLDLLMLINLGLLTYTTWQDNMKVLRVGYIISSILLFVYNILVHAYVGAVSELIMFIASFVSFIRYDVINKIDNIVLTFYKTISEMYKTKVRENSKYTQIISQYIDDVYNNFIYVSKIEDFKEVVQQTNEQWLQVNRTPAYYVKTQNRENMHKIMDVIRENKLLYHDVWMKLRSGYNTNFKHCMLENVICKPCGEKEKKDIIHIFDAGFVHQLGDGVYKYEEDYLNVFGKNINDLFLHENKIAPYMAYYNHQPIALLICYRNGTNGFLCQITTLLPYRRKGVASKLIRYAIAAERKLGMGDFYLVTEKYTGLEAFYMKNNFEEVAEGFCIGLKAEQTNKRKA